VLINVHLLVNELCEHISCFFETVKNFALKLWKASGILSVVNHRVSYLFWNWSQFIRSFSGTDLLVHVKLLYHSALWTCTKGLGPLMCYRPSVSRTVVTKDIRKVCSLWV